MRSYAYDTGACVVLFDPIDPPAGVDESVDGRDVAVLLTAEWHRRSADRCVARYGGRIFEPHGHVPAGVERRATYYDGEHAYWLPRHAALVVGDAFLNERGFSVQDEWLPDGVTREQMLAGLRRLLELPVELILVTHGDPVTENARDALRAVLDG